MSVTITGVDDLMKTLRKALQKHSVNEVRQALKRGAMVIVNEAKARVRVNDGGKLQESIKIMPKWSGAPSVLFVGPRVRQRFTKRTSQKIKDANPFYAHFVEYGTDPHNLGYKGKFTSGKGSGHPGAKKMPYMRPAYDMKAQEALNVAMEDLTKMIESNVR